MIDACGAYAILKKAQATAAVARGVKVLDTKVPGWWRVIKLEQLDMASCHTCMLGQLFGYDTEVAVGAKIYGLPTEWPRHSNNTKYSAYKLAEQEISGYQRGVKVLEADNIGCNRGNICNEDYTYNDLKCAWANVIADRRANDIGTEDSGDKVKEAVCLTETP